LNITEVDESSILGIFQGVAVQIHRGTE